MCQESPPVRVNDDERTAVEEVHARAVAPDVQVLLQQPAAFHAQLGEVVPSVVAEQQLASWLEHL